MKMKFKGIIKLSEEDKKKLQEWSGLPKQSLEFKPKPVEDIKATWEELGRDKNN